MQDIVIGTEKRSLKFNKMIHGYFNAVAKKCIESGLTIGYLNKFFEINVDEVVIKKFAQTIAEVKYGTPHTSQLTNKELSDVMEQLDKILVNAGIDVHTETAEFKSLLENQK